MRRLGRQKNVLLALGTYDHRTHRGVAAYAGKHRWHLNCEMCIWGRLPRGWRGDGILTALDFQPELVRFVKEAGVPVVDLSLNREDVPLARVVGDHYRIGVMAAEHFMERGFRRFAWHANDTRPPAERRWAGFAESLAKQGLKAEKWIWRGGSRRASDLWRAKSQWLGQRLRGIAKPAAVFAFRDADAANVLDACLAEGILVPEEVAVLGVDNNELICETLAVQLSSVHHDLERIGYEGAALLDRLMKGQPASERAVLIPPRGIVTRQSTEVLAINHEGCRRALKFLQANLGRNIGVADAARAGSLSRRGLEKAFRQHIGRSVAQELTRLRIARAKELLVGTDSAVVDIAARTGFQTPQYLSHVFHKTTGLTPRTFRRTYRDQAAG